MRKVTEPQETNSQTPYLKILQPYRTLGIDTLRVSIDLQSFLSHFRIPQKLQRHPNKMPFDLIELLSDLLRRHVRIVQVALFVFAVFGEERLVVVEGFDCGMWLR